MPNEKPMTKEAASRIQGAQDRHAHHGDKPADLGFKSRAQCPYGDSGSRSVPKVGFFSLIQGQLCPQKFVFIAFREVGFFPPIFGRSVTGQGLSQKPACMSIC